MPGSAEQPLYLRAAVNCIDYQLLMNKPAEEAATAIGWDRSGDWPTYELATDAGRPEAETRVEDKALALFEAVFGLGAELEDPFEMGARMCQAVYHDAATARAAVDADERPGP